MEKITLQFLYGQEFWDRLEFLLSEAKERVFLLSAYIGDDTYKEYINEIPDGVFTLVACRNDSGFKPPNALIVDKEHFHGKLYLVDNTIIIGSQNLYNANKEGEFSTLIETDNFSSSLILYQALLKIIEDTNIQAEPISTQIASLYDDGSCPFCGNDFLPEPKSLQKCPGYGFGFVTNNECESYGEDGACKFCLIESREPIGDALCCDNEECGIGISLSDNKLLYHAINPTKPIDITKAKDFLRLFKYFESKNMNAMMLFQKLGFIGKVYSTHANREVFTFINTNH